MNDSTIERVPIPDSPNNDAFEAIVELHYQLQGYITSSGKWFGKLDDKEKKKRVYPDIDVLAINGEETLIVSVTTCLSDKIDKKGKIKKLNTYYDDVQDYLKGTKEYKWLTQNGRIKKVIAYKEGYKQKKTIEKYEDIFKDADIKHISGEEIAEKIMGYLEANRSKDKQGMDVCIKNPLLKIVEFMNDCYVPSEFKILDM